MVEDSAGGICFFFDDKSVEFRGGGRAAAGAVVVLVDRLVDTAGAGAAGDQSSCWYSSCADRFTAPKASNTDCGCLDDEEDARRTLRLRGGIVFCGYFTIAIHQNAIENDAKGERKSVHTHQRGTAGAHRVYFDGGGSVVQLEREMQRGSNWVGKRQLLNQIKICV
jgi:hypothetical protein